MPVENGDFNIPGAHSGIPLGWTIRALWQTRQMSAFAGNPRLGMELFVWAGTPVSVDDFQVAVFDAVPETVEDFFEGWLLPRATYFTTLVSGIAESGIDDDFDWIEGEFISLWGDLPDVDPASDEAFDINDYVRLWEDVDSEAAAFDGMVDTEVFDGGEWSSL